MLQQATMLAHPEISARQVKLYRGTAQTVAVQLQINKAACVYRYE
jgi:hypothetical protein